jgi:hypothetical protein
MGIFKRNRSSHSTSVNAQKAIPMPLSKFYFDLSILGESDIPSISHGVSFRQMNWDGQNFIGEGFLFYHKKLKMLFACPNKWNDPEFEVFLHNMDQSPDTRLVAANHELDTSVLNDLGDGHGILSIRTNTRRHISFITHDASSAEKMNTYLNRYCIEKSIG